MFPSVAAAGVLDATGIQRFPVRIEDLFEDQIWGLLGRRIGDEVAKVAKDAVCVNVANIQASRHEVSQGTPRAVMISSLGRLLIYVPGEDLRRI